MSSSEGGGRPPPTVFRLKTSLRRTPPGVTMAATVTPSPPQRSLVAPAADISAAVYEAVVATESPGRSTPAVQPLTTPQASQPGGTAKRVLSPDEWTAVASRSKRRFNPRVGGISTPLTTALRAPAGTNLNLSWRISLARRLVNYYHGRMRPLGLFQEWWGDPLLNLMRPI
ncbi:unnamed protein product [Diatraea saccharalis]|uniref:Uncharacterized protein n=1 Tax=Diatraea saccharalis TaxID=40085 RepID=A0A9N9WF72_9NEOP|nr:unnamed protein product [Diatraea saccharalis]